MSVTLRLRRRTIACAILLTCIASRAFAADGDFDGSFGGGGYQYLLWNLHQPTQPIVDQVVATVPLPDGSVILVGNISDIGGLGRFNAIGIAKLSANGAFDAAFGDTGDTPGQTALHGGASDSIAAGAATLTRDGKLVVAGTYVDAATGNQSMAVWQFTANGQLDPSFGSGGQAILDRPTPHVDVASAVATAYNSPYVTDDSIVVAGGFEESPSGPRDAGAFRIDAQGNYVADWGNEADGPVPYFRIVVDCGPQHVDSAFLAMGATSAGPLLDLVGYFDCGAGHAGMIVALDSAGIREPTFGNDGFNYFYFDANLNTTLTAIARDSNAIGAVTVAGYTLNSATGETHMGIARLTSFGAFDTTFGITGAGYEVVDIPFVVGTVVHEDYSVANSVLVQRDGAILLGGYTGYDSATATTDASLVRLTAQGFDDTSFNPAFIPTNYARLYPVPVNGADAGGQATSIVFSEGEKVLLGGWTSDSSVPGSRYFSVARIDGDEIFASGFGTPDSDP